MIYTIFWVSVENSKDTNGELLMIFRVPEQEHVKNNIRNS